MFRCDRCGTGFSPIRVRENEFCPRCRARDGVSARLSFAPFTSTEVEGVASSERVEEGPPDDEGLEQAAG
jgi:hypothetical protein